MSGLHKTREQGRSNPAKPVESNGAARKRSAEPMTVVLEHARWRHFRWALTGLTLGGLLLLQLGTLGQLLGLVIAGFGGLETYRFARTLLHPPGTIAITPEHVDLPLGLCRGHTERVAVDAIRHVYFLRRSVPWLTTGPILIIETGDHAHLYPRDWFPSELAQRQLAQTIQRFLPKDTGPTS